MQYLDFASLTFFHWAVLSFFELQQEPISTRLVGCLSYFRRYGLLLGSVVYPKHQRGFTV